MNATKIHQMAVASLAGTLPFTEIVGNLLAEGVDEKKVPGTISRRVAGWLLSS